MQIFLILEQAKSAAMEKHNDDAVLVNNLPQKRYSLTQVLNQHSRQEVQKRHQKSRGTFRQRAGKVEGCLQEKRLSIHRTN